MLRRVEAILAGRSPWFTVFVAIAIAAIVATIDFAVGGELAMGAVYLLPVALVLWFVRASATIVVAAMCAFLNLGVDLASDAEWSHFLVPYWNFLVTGSLYIAFVALLRTLRRAISEEKEAARTDVLTGLANTRRFFEIADMELARSRRYGHPFTVVYVDIDDFKDINDRYGHGHGDEILRVVAACLRTTTRASDLVARLGGDEFAVLLPETHPEGAAVFLDRLQNACVLELDAAAVTVSIGAVSYVDPPASREDMIAAADELMYAAKRGGKDSVQHRVEGERPSLAISLGRDTDARR